jgi:cytidine deaminase
MYLPSEFDAVHALWHVDVGEEHLHVICKLKTLPCRPSHCREVISELSTDSLWLGKVP